METNLKDLGKYPVYILDADSDAVGQWLAEVVKEKFPNAEVKRLPIGPVIGAHCGPGTVGLVYYGENR